MTTAPGERVTFRGSLARRALGALVLSAVLGSAALFLLPSVLPVTTNRSTRATLAIIATVIVVILVWGSALWQSNTRVVVDAASVEIRRPGQLIHRWDRATSTFSSRITKRYTNGIPSGVDRTLIVDSAGRRDEVNVALTREGFTELMALLAPLSARVAAVAQAETATAFSTAPRSFSPSPAPIRRRARRAGFVAGVVAIIAIVTLGLAASGILVEDDREIALIIVAPMLGVLTVILAALAMVTAGKARSVPSRIDVGTGSVTVDGQVFIFAQQRAVQLSPPAYPRRTLVIVEGTGRKHRWLLGEPGASTRVPAILPDYPELVAAVAASAVGAENVVRLDLE
ncbi:hypothetical protein ITJ43_10840 [Microbacterium sp. VKM Ac-2870]|uniref:hypothetical protein n=1 Tax=Microbacterium sp. VKM Ac-2870 TaxID=2783825 RepID=UPI001889D2FE|nr:hypothetical protein [Microbacterium sp. VKM Ac-2870]MBF4562637.1 hypothetical protein [Microbacterium sp. VKM Ac-2870]